MSIKLDMIGLAVKDIAKSLDFYRKLGIEVPDTFEGPYCEATLPGGIRLSWNDIEMIRSIGGWFEPAGQRVSMAFLCESPAAVDAKYAEMMEAGYKGEKEPWDAFWGQRYAQVEDPDGNVVDLFAWLR